MIMSANTEILMTQAYFKRPLGYTEEWMAIFAQVAIHPNDKLSHEIDT